MLKSIEKIKGLGVYQSYNKPDGTHDFGIKNLIYGWNYAGKTTLSRLFAQLESKLENPDLSGSEFTFLTSGDPVTEKNFNQCDLSVRVFNSDFVRSNLHFDGDSFNPILLLGKDSDTAQKKINQLNQRTQRALEIQKQLDKKSTELNTQIAQSRTNSAKLIRQLLKIDPYTATHLGQDLLAIAPLKSQLLKEQDLSEAIALALTSDANKPSTVDELSFFSKINDIYADAVTILAATPSFSNTIKHLEDNPVIEQWVEDGLKLHPATGKCEFCGNNISQDQLDAFRAHFSKDLADHKSIVADLLLRVKAATLTLSWPKPRELNTQFRESYIAAIESLPLVIESFNQAVKTLAQEVQYKVVDSRRSMKPTPLPPDLEAKVEDAVTKVNLIIKKNNELALNFTSEKENALKRARYHYVQQFKDEQIAIGLEQKRESCSRRSALLKKYAFKLQPEINKLQTQISQAQQGRAKINERLTSMLGSEAIQINVVNDKAGQERFQLVRKTGVVAKNLSDGERTAVAFSYFLTKLQEIKPEDFEETIVYIDDPISSLDANHIFQVTAAIRAVFFQQPDKNSPWKTTCKQLFVSTHNFEFFNLLREIKPISIKQGANLYLIRRLAEKSSRLENMPTSLARYQSEYHFLFEIIHQFHNAPDKTSHEVLMLLPNAMRRFLELYTYSRLPGPKDSDQVDDRAEILFGVERAKRILKIFHYFSHGNTLDRLAGNNELIFDLEHAITDLMEAITETDKQHMDALIAATRA